MKTFRNAVLTVAALPFLFATAGTAFAQTASADEGATLKAVKERGELLCGVNPSRFGFSSLDSKGQWSGFDITFCRVIAAAVLGDADKVRFVALSGQQRFPAIQSGEVDVLSRNTSATLSRDTSLGLEFSPVVFYDGLGFMAHKSAGATKVADLNGAAICVGAGSTTENTVANLFKKLNLNYKPVVIDDNAQISKTYFSGRCDVMARDQSSLPGMRQYEASNPDDHVILDGVFSKEPLAIAVRQGDSQWINIIRWVTYATIEAEELGVSRSNVDEMKSSSDPSIQALLGVNGNYGEMLGLDEEWAYRIVKQVGNYGEIYDSAFGPDTPLELPRGNNALWTEGGLMYSWPVR